MSKPKKLKDGTLVVRKRIDNERVTIHGKTMLDLKTQEFAMRDAARRRRLGLHVEEPKPKMVTFGEQFDRAMAVYTGRPQSKKALEYNVKRCLGRFGDVRLDKITTYDIEAFFAGSKLAATTDANTLKGMTYVFNRAVEERFIDKNPATGANLRKPVYEAHPFESLEEVDHVVSCFDSVVHQAFVLYECSTGPRLPQELLPLKWSDQRDGLMWINRTIQDGKIEEGIGKNGTKSIRPLVQSDRALAALDLLPRPIRRDTFIWQGKRSDLMNYARWRESTWPKALEKAGVYPRSPYAMRDTFICLALMAHTPIEAVSQQTDHSISTLMTHYFKWMPGHREAMRDHLNSAWAGQSGHKAATSTTAEDTAGA